MKLLVLSDSHGHDERLVNMILEHPDADAVIFLGDGEWDFENAVKVCGIREDRIVCQVKGNCDLASREPERIIREFGGIRFLITHGHRQHVKYGIWNLVDEAKKLDCKGAFFGHTHRQINMVKEGITLINPGSAGAGSCSVVEVADGKIQVLEE